MGDRLRLGVLATHPVQYHAPLYRALVAAGVDLTVFFAHRPTPEEQGTGFGVAFEWDVDLTSGYRHVFLRNRARRPSVSRFWGCDVPEIGDEIARGRFDAFLVSGWHSLAYGQAIRACRANHVPVMVRGDSQLDTSTGVRRIAKKILYPRLIGLFDVCLSVGSRSREYFEAYGARCVVCAPHFVDNEFFASASEIAGRDRGEIRRKWGISEDATVVLFAGKLLSWKRPIDLLEAVRSLDDPRLAVLFAGDGELRVECERRASDMRSSVRFAGFLNQTEMARAYAAADLLVLPSEARETWGLVVNEAMASGRAAIVSSAAGCAPDMVVEGVTGHTYPVGDVAELAARLRTLVAAPATRRRMSESARQHVGRFSASAAARGVIEGAERARALSAA